VYLFIGATYASWSGIGQPLCRKHLGNNETPTPLIVQEQAIHHENITGVNQHGSDEKMPAAHQRPDGGPCRMRIGGAGSAKSAGSIGGAHSRCLWNYFQEDRTSTGGLGTNDESVWESERRASRYSTAGGFDCCGESCNFVSHRPGDDFVIEGCCHLVRQLESKQFIRYASRTTNYPGCTLRAIFCTG